MTTKKDIGTIHDYLDPATERPECGTQSGYHKHHLAREVPCEPCKEASRQTYWKLVAEGRIRHLGDPS